MSLQAVLSNARAGDILLTRRKTDKTRQRTTAGICGYWREAYLCLADGRLLALTDDGTTQVVKLEELLQILAIGNNLALFRVFEEMPEGAFEKICASILRELKWECNGFHMRFISEELIKIGYREVGVELGDPVVWKISPFEFDESPATFRIV